MCNVLNNKKMSIENTLVHTRIENVCVPENKMTIKRCAQLKINCEMLSVRMGKNINHFTIVTALLQKKLLNFCRYILTIVFSFHRRTYKYSKANFWNKIYRNRIRKPLTVLQYHSISNRIIWNVLLNRKRQAFWYNYFNWE